MSTISADSTAASESKISKVISPTSEKDAIPSNASLLSFFEKMLLIRRFEERASQLYGMGSICGFCHLCIGQEAVCVGLAKSLIKGDSVITSYRDHGIMLALGSDPLRVMAELTGRDIGYSKGKGGSMHIYDVQHGFYGGNGIVGAQVPLGTGLAFAMKYRGQSNVSVTMLGDGAINQGQVYEAFNMAKLWKLPVLYVIENNEYAMGTSVARACATTDLSQRGLSFGIPGIQVDGMDVLAVKEVCSKAIAEIRRTNEPLILEMKTYRYRGHSMSDPANYRTKDEVNNYRKLDPIERLRELLIVRNVATEEKLEAIEEAVAKRVSEVAKLALEAVEPPIEELETDIYA